MDPLLFKPIRHVIVRLVLLLGLAVIATWFLPVRNVLGIFVGLCILTATRLAIAVRSMMDPTPFIDTTVEGDELQQERRPWNDAVLHVLLFQWQVFGTESATFCNLLEHLNRGFDTWDMPFKDQGQDPETEILKYCSSYGVTPPNEKGEWAWNKSPADYQTMNEFFTRIPRSLEIGSGEIVSPCTACSPDPKPGFHASTGLPKKFCIASNLTIISSLLALCCSSSSLSPLWLSSTPFPLLSKVITMFDNVSMMPKVLKNSDFTIAKCGIPQHEEYEPHPCFIHYLSPADYHCYHSPMEGVVVEVREELDGPYSVTVKPYVFRYINILARNRRVVVVIENEKGFRVAMVILGGITVDSIRLVEGFKKGMRIAKGQRIGSFARGGSSIAMFFNRPVVLEPRLQEIRARPGGLGFKVAVASDLVQLKRRRTVSC